MDPVSQIALGAAIGDAGFGRRLGGKAALVGGLCGLVPDLDVAAAVFSDRWTMLVHHRAWSHSLILLPLLAPLVAWLAWRWDERRSPCLAWAHLALWALLTHPVLDWFTSYGTVMFLPLTWRRFAGDGVFIIDPIYTLPLVAALVWSWRKRRRGPAERSAVEEAGAESPGDAQTLFARARRFLARLEGRKITAAALAVTTAYLVFGLGVTAWAKSVARGELAERGFEPVDVRAMPMAFFPLIRRVVARDAGGTIMAGGVSLWARRPIDFARFDLPDDPLVRKALASEEGGTFAWFADGYVAARVERDGATGRATVRLLDGRYGFLTDPAASPFGAGFEFGADGRPARAALLHEGMDLDFGGEIAAMWRLTWGAGR